MVELWRVLQNKDLEMQVHSSLKVASQVDRVVVKVLVAFIGKDIQFKNWVIMMQLYKSLVRPHLEYCA